MGDAHTRTPQMIPLETTPLYSPDSYPNPLWTGPRDTVQWSIFMREVTTAGNAIARFELERLAPTLNGAHIGEPPKVLHEKRRK